MSRRPGSCGLTAVLFSAVTVLSLFAMGPRTRPRQRSTRTGMVLRIVAGVLNAAALSALLYYLVPNLEIGRGMLGSDRRGRDRRQHDRAHVVRSHRRPGSVQADACSSTAPGGAPRSLLELRRRSDQRGFRIVGFIVTEGDDARRRPSSA